jgi:RES domain-containing protein
MGGRWNPVGTPVVYASTSLSLAVLEVFVHMTARAGPEDYVSVSVNFGVQEPEIERVNPADLPDDWRRTNHPMLQALGASWATSKRSPLLLVPSVIVEGEWNVLINPLHPTVAAMTIETPKPFHFDERLFKARR